MSEILIPAPRRHLIEFGVKHGQVRHADDSAYSDARVPTCHAASHGQNGSDPLTPESIGAACACHKHGIEDLTGVAAEKHNHAFADIVGAAPEKHRHSFTDLDDVAAARHSHKFEELSGVAAEKHRHSYEELSGVAPSRHTHSTDEIVEGVFSAERVLSSPKVGEFLRVGADGRLETASLADLAEAVRELLATDEAK